MATLTIPEYKSVIERSTEDAIKSKLRKTQTLNTLNSPEDLLIQYQRAVGRSKIGQSQVGIGDIPAYGELVRSLPLNRFFTKIVEDLGILYDEANNIDSFLNFLRIRLAHTIDSQSKYINQIRADGSGLIDLDVNNVNFTDIVQNNFAISLNNTTSNFQALVDTDSERLKLQPIRTYNWAGYFKNRVNAEIFSYGTELAEEENRLYMFSNDKTRPWWMIGLSRTPQNGFVKGIDFSDYPGMIVGVQIGFENIRPINQIKIAPTSTDRLDILGILYNDVDVERNWNQLDVSQKQLNDFFLEWNFKRIFAREIILILGQKDFIHIGESYNASDTRLSAEHIVRQELGLYNRQLYGYKKIEEDQPPISTPFSDNIKAILERIRLSTLKDPDPDLKQYVIGLNSIEINYHEYLSSGKYEGETYKADGNIIEIQLDDLNKIDVEQDTGILNTVINHDLRIEGNEYPIAQIDNDGYINEGTLIKVDDNNIKYTWSRFLIDTTEDFFISYNGELLLPSEYIISDPQNGIHLITLNTNKVIINDVIGLRYKPPITNIDGTLYYPNVFNSIKQIGMPNLIIADGNSFLSEDIYVFPITPTPPTPGPYSPDKSNPILYEDGKYRLVELDGIQYIEIANSDLKTAAADYDYTVISSEDIHTLPDAVYIPLEYVSLPQRGFYFGGFREDFTVQTSGGDKYIDITDGSLSVNDDTSGYKRGCILIEKNGNSVTNITSYGIDISGDIKNKQRLFINDPFINVGDIIQASYIPINTGYVNQKINIRNNNIIENFNGSNQDNTVFINNVPFIDQKIISDQSFWNYSNGIFNLKDNVSIVYEPIKVTIDNFKAINRTEYFTGDNPILETTENIRETEYLVVGNKIIFNRTIGENELIRVEYYELAGEITIINTLYRIDGTAVEITPELYNYTILANIKK